MKDYIKIINSRLLDDYDIDENLHDFHSYKISSAFSQDQIQDYKFFSIDYESELSSCLIDEICRCVHKSILEAMNNSDNYEFIYLENVENNENITREISHLFTEFDNVIVNDVMGSLFYKEGLFPSLFNTHIHLNHHLRYNDYRMYFFDKIYINLKNFTENMINDGFNKRRIMGFDFAYKLSDFKVICIITPENKHLYKSEIRDFKINSILN